MPVTVARPTRLAAPTGILTAWHLVSLDAPTVAVLWTMFFARIHHQTIPAAELFAMFLAVWLLYASDRLLDARSQQDLAPRHHFHHRNARVFKLFLAVAAIILLPLLFFIPRPDLTAEALLALILAFWFALVHLTTLRLPKELITAIFFAAATALPTFLRDPQPRTVLTAACFFAALCLANGLFISAWEEHPQRRRLPTLLCGLLILPTLIHSTPIHLATALAAATLLLLDRLRRHLQPTTLRAAADLALLTPALLWPFLH